MADPTAHHVTSKPAATPLFRPQRSRLTGFKVMLDGCALVCDPVRDVLLWSAWLALFRPVWSADVIGELRAMRIERFKLPPARADYSIEQMRKAFPEAEIGGYTALIPVMTNDQRKRHVLAAAIVANAHVIVTDDLEHFGIAACENYDIEALTADEFLRDLLELDADRMIEVLATVQARREMGPVTIDELLAELEASGCPSVRRSSSKHFSLYLRIALDRAFSGHAAGHLGWLGSVHRRCAINVLLPLPRSIVSRRRR